MSKKQGGLVVLRFEELAKEKFVKIKKYFEQNNKYIIDFSEVKGQENIKRALEVSAAGGHNCLLIRKPRFSVKL